MSSLLSNLTNNLKKLFGGGSHSAGAPPFVERLMNAIKMTQVEERGCEEVHELVDKYAEAYLAGQNVAHLMPLVKHHLDMCGNCREEFEMLLEMMQFEAKSA